LDANTGRVGIDVLADYGNWATWIESSEVGRENVDPAELGISDPLVAELNAWADEFTRTLNQDYPPGSGFGSAAERREFLDRGRRLAARLAAELPPNYDVLFRGDGVYDDDLPGPERVPDTSAP
jgi:hypothetical protein